MYDWSDLYGMDTTAQYGRMNSWNIIGLILALVGAVAVAIIFIRSENRAYYTGWMKRISVHVNFERYIIPLILKFLYVFTALAAIFNGIITMFTSSFWLGLIMTIFLPIVVRLLYELIMMLFSIHDGIMETNRLLRGGSRPQNEAPMTPRQQQYGRAPQYAENEPAQPPQPDPRGEHTEPQPPKQYPGGYDPMHRG